jgi:hypothetical protein
MAPMVRTEEKRHDTLRQHMSQVYSRLASILQTPEVFGLGLRSPKMGGIPPIVAELTARGRLILTVEESRV